jgi:GAF domain-containing protein
MKSKRVSTELETQSDQNSSRVQGMRLALGRYCLPVVLPIASAVTTAVAAVNHGSDRVYWSIGAVAAIAGTATINVLKERRAVVTRKNVEQIKTELAITLADIGLPLVTALGSVNSAQSLDDATASISVLIDSSVSLAQTQLGHQGDVPCRIRAAYYEFDGDKLTRNNYHTWAGAKPPRIDFDTGRSDHDNDVIKLARGEEVRFIRNLKNEPLPFCSDSDKRSYKSFISVPVRAGKKSFGLLTADSDTAYTLTNADQGFLILVAGILAAGLAHVEAIRIAAKGS